jgi:phenylpyruvate tautomerase PptA (4-oxalocrotonate tautomerase family)
VPIVVIHAFDRPEAVKRETVEGITQLMCRTYGVRPENITVRFEVLARDKVAHGGVLVGDMPAQEP